ncbi:MAG: DUF3160 domain-containing protein [candidate division WOR-3 bacterium]
MLKLLLFTLISLINDFGNLAHENSETTLKEKGFIVFETDYSNFPAVYRKLESSGEPLFITIDPLLHGVHLIFNYSLRRIEEDYLFEELEDILTYLRTRLSDLVLVKNKQISEAARTDLAYIEVAIKLLNPEFKPSKIVEHVVQEEISLIEEHKGFDTSRVLNILEDYSQYKPRGHYTRTPKLENYFKAIMFLGRMPFYISPDNNREKERNIHLTRCAILMAFILEENAQIKEKYERIYRVTSYFVGSGDDFSIIEIIPYIRRHFPAFPEGFSEDMEIIKFAEELKNLKRPAIFSTYFEDIENPEQKLVSVKFMSQRFIPDSYIFQNLVYPVVGTRTKPRLFPKSLDILAVLENRRAKEILIEYYKENKYKNYQKMLDSLTKQFSNFPRDYWHQNAYFHWLYIIKTLNSPSAFPTRMKTYNKAYQDKLLVTQRAFWAELRHDTILYAKQSYTAKVTALPPEPKISEILIEPLPETYKELINFLENLKDTLSTYGMLNEEISEKINHLSNFTQSLLYALEKQQKGEKIPDKLKERLYKFSDFLENIYTFSPDFAQSYADTLLPLVADVHTDVNTKTVLQVAVGRPLEIWVFHDGKMYKGAMFSYYEFTYPLDKRLTDEEWHKMTCQGTMEEWLSFPLVEKSKQRTEIKD